MSAPTPLSWPALIHYPGDAELEYIADDSAWQTWEASPGAARLIDSHGIAYAITPDRRLTLLNHMTLEEILILIRAHAAQEGICCTSKIGAISIPAAINLLSSLSVEPGCNQAI